MRRQGVEDLENRLTIRAKQPPVIRHRIEDHALRCDRGQLATLHVESDVRPTSSRSTILVAKKLPIESVSASPGEPATRPRQVDADARDGEVQPLARTSRHSRRGPRTRSHGLAHCALASASTGQTALIPCHSTRL